MIDELTFQYIWKPDFIACHRNYLSWLCWYNNKMYLNMLMGFEDGAQIVDELFLASLNKAFISA